MRSPTNQVIVNIRPKYIRHISSIMKLAFITDESTISPSDLVNIVGEVISLPKKIETHRREYKGFTTEDIRVGDTAIFSYKIVFDLIPPPMVVEDDTIEPVYRNRFFYKGEEYFTADITNIFGVIRDGEIIMINGYAMLENYKQQTIILPQYYRKNRRTSQSTLIGIGNPKTTRKKIDATTEDEILFDGRMAQHYKVNDKEFVILQQEQMLAKII